MAPVYADHPFTLISSPVFLKGKDDKPDSFDEIASEMANVHNMMVRGLNAIYLQAPHVQPSDEKHFCTFIMHWHKVIFTHHAGEEEHAFPAIEAMAGVKGIMENNVEQHHAFHGGLETLGAYVTDCKAGKQKYDGRKIVEIIDGFGAALAEHLADEIPTLVGLRQYGEKMAGFAKMFSEEGDKAIKQLGLFTLCACFAMLDIHYENDLWINWPPAPGIIKFICRSIIWRWNANVVKFGAVDSSGTMKPLYAVPEDPQTST